MGFRTVEREPDEPTSKATPAVPMRWVALGVVAVVSLALLPVVLGLTMGVLSVALDVQRHDNDRVVERIVPDVDHSELEPRKRVYPEYPDAATEMNLPTQRCLAAVMMDENGTPFDVDVTGCPDVFVQPTKEAMLKWRWNPPTHEGHPTSARTTIAVTYKMKDFELPMSDADAGTPTPTDAEREARRQEMSDRLQLRRTERVQEQAAAATAEVVEGLGAQCDGATSAD